MAAERYWGYALRALMWENGKREPDDLHGYVFADWAHAEKWIRQAGPRESIHAVLYRRRSCCGEPYAFKWGAKMLQVDIFAPGEASTTEAKVRAELIEQRDGGRVWDDAVREALSSARSRGWGKHHIGNLEDVENAR